MLSELHEQKMQRLRPRLHPAVSTALRRQLSSAHARLEQPHRLRPAPQQSSESTTAGDDENAGGSTAASECDASCALLQRSSVARQQEAQAMLLDFERRMAALKAAASTAADDGAAATTSAAQPREQAMAEAILEAERPCARLTRSQRLSWSRSFSAADCAATR